MCYLVFRYSDKVVGLVTTIVRNVEVHVLDLAGVVRPGKVLNGLSASHGGKRRLQQQHKVIDICQVIHK